MALPAAPWIGFGAMRLATTEPQRAEATLRAALSAGVNLVDTADVYGASDDDVHGNERWLASRLPKAVSIATKGGLVRAGGRWRPDGRAKALRDACAGSSAALQRDPLDLYLLHAPDPRTSLATSARALARLVADGRVERVGLCNTGVDQIREVEAFVPVAAVQVAVSPFDGDAIRGGVIEYCRERRIAVLAHSPFGGPKRAARIAKDDELTAIGVEHGVGPYGVVLAWLSDLGVVPLPGPTRPEHVGAIVEARRVELTEGDRRRLDGRFPLGRWLRTPRRARRPPDDRSREVVILMGTPAAGKTTAAAELVDEGYTRFNRDEAMTTMAKLHRRLDAHLSEGGGRAVLDNTYPTRAIRHGVIEVAWRHGRSVRCIWLATSLEDAQVNAVERLWRLFGRLPEPEEVRAASRKTPNVFSPDVLLRFRDQLEAPVEEEGFSAVERRPFVRRSRSHRRSATLIAEDVIDSAAAGSAVAAETGPVAVIAWWPGIDEAAAQTAEARVMARFRRPVSVFACRHPVRARCWCLLPLPGLTYAAIATLGLDPTRSTWVGRGPTHRRAAERLSMRFIDAR